MLYFDPIILEEFFLPTKLNPQTELQKATEIRNQINASIDWMNFILPNDKDKDNLRKDIVVATRERDRLNKELNSIKV